MIQQISRFMSKTVVYHGMGGTRLVGGEAAKLGIKRVLIITDQGVRRAGLLQGVEESLSTNGVEYEIFDEVEEDADVEVIHRIALRIKKEGRDGLVVVGGGSPICAAKGGALEATNDVEDIRALGGVNQYKNPPLPVICLPTTAGSGSDVSWAFPVVDHSKGREFSLAGDHIQPPVSILDPLLLKTCPPKPMIYAGLDALSHAVEALWGGRATFVTDALAFETIRLVMHNLREAALTENMEAKSNQHLASALANMACGNAGLGIVHGIAISVGNLKGPHGYKCGMLLPFAIEFNMPVCEAKFAKMATLLGETSHDKTTRELAGLFLLRVKQLLVDLDFPRKFEEENLPRENIPGLIEEIRQFIPSFLDSNLRRVTDEDVARMCEAALKGWE